MKQILTIALMLTLGVSFGQVNSDSYQERLEACQQGTFPCCNERGNGDIPNWCCWLYAANDWITPDNSDDLLRRVVTKEMSEDPNWVNSSGRDTLRNQEGKFFFPSTDAVRTAMCIIVEEYNNGFFEPIDVEAMCRVKLGPKKPDCLEKGIQITGYALPKVFVRYNCEDTFLIISQEEITKLFPKQTVVIPMEEVICEGDSLEFFSYPPLKKQDMYMHQSGDTIYYLDLNVTPREVIYEGVTLNEDDVPYAIGTDSLKEVGDEVLITTYPKEGCPFDSLYTLVYIEKNPEPQVNPCDTCYNDFKPIQGLQVEGGMLLDGRQNYGQVFSQAPYAPRFYFKVGYSYLFPKDKGLFKSIPCLAETLGGKIGIRTEKSIFLPEDDCDCQGNEAVNQSLTKVGELEYGIHYLRSMRNKNMKSTGLVASLYFRYMLEYNSVSEVSDIYEQPGAISHRLIAATRFQKSFKTRSSYFTPFVETGYDILNNAPQATVGVTFSINKNEKSPKK